MWQQSPYDELAPLPGPVGQQPAYFWAGANQWPDPALVTVHYRVAPQPYPSDEANHVLGLQAPGVERRGQIAASVSPRDTPSTPQPWQPGAFPGNYRGLRAPRPNEAVVGPDYNPGEPLGLLG